MKRPKYSCIERAAAAMAAEFYSAGIASGMKSRFPDAQSYAEFYFYIFIPRAVSYLTDMLAMDSVGKHLKDEIYAALVERNNDMGAMVLNNAAHGRPDAFNLPPNWLDDNTKLKERPKHYNPETKRFVNEDLDNEASIKKRLSDFAETKH